MLKTIAKPEIKQDEGDNLVLVRQLEWEISCLEKQLGRIKLFQNQSGTNTSDTYEKMISIRKEMLSELSF